MEITANMPKVNYAEWVFHDVSPFYLQLSQKLKWGILSSQFQPGESLPSVREMALLLHINPNTVSRAYKMIRDEGLLEQAKGKIYKIISDNVLIQKKRAEEVQTLCFNYLREAMALGFSQEEALFLVKNYIQKLTHGDNQENG